MISGWLMKLEYYEKVISIENEQNLDSLKKPAVAFYSPEKIVLSILALDLVREDIKSLLQKGIGLEIYRTYGRLVLQFDKTNPYFSEYHNGDGIQMLREGINELNSDGFYLSRCLRKLGLARRLLKGLR